MRRLSISVFFATCLTLLLTVLAGRVPYRWGKLLLWPAMLLVKDSDPEGLFAPAITYPLGMLLSIPIYSFLIYLCLASAKMLRSGKEGGEAELIRKETERSTGNERRV